MLIKWRYNGDVRDRLFGNDRAIEYYFTVNRTASSNKTASPLGLVNLDTFCGDSLLLATSNIDPSAYGCTSKTAHFTSNVDFKNLDDGNLTTFSYYVSAFVTKPGEEFSVTTFGYDGCALASFQTMFKDASSPPEDYAPLDPQCNRKQAEWSLSFLRDYRSPILSVNPGTTSFKESLQESGALIFDVWGYPWNENEVGFVRNKHRFQSS